LYFQDDWKVSRKLLLNLGLRWDKDYNMIGGSDIKNSRTYLDLVTVNSPISNPYVSSIAHDDNLDFSPRIGFAYDISGRGTHVLRGGYGLYYGNVFQNIPLFMEQQGNATIFQGVLSLSGADIVPGTGIPLNQWKFGVDPLPTIPAPSGTLANGATGRLIDPNYRNPVTEETNVGYSWGLSTNSVIELEYVHVLSLHENRTINVDPNIPVDPNNINTLSRTGAPGGFFRPFDAGFAAAGVPVLGSVRDEQSSGRSRYDGLNVSYKQRMTHHVSVQANYTLSRALGYDIGTNAGFRNYPRDPQNPFSPFEFGPTFQDERHHVTVSGILDLPLGIEFSPILQIGSARPYNVFGSTNELNLGGGSDSGAIVVPNSDPTNYTAFLDATGSIDQLASSKCYYSGQCHVVGFNSLRGNPYYDMDARLAKNIKMGESRNLQLSFQAFNLFNHANYGNNFQSDPTSSTFRQPLGFINPTSTTLPRAFIGEFGVRFTF
ncbi:MAG TPA: hypothetical protein VGC88_04565, partial [Terriglobales bacterium]